MDALLLCIALVLMVALAMPRVGVTVEELFEALW